MPDESTSKSVNEFWKGAVWRPIGFDEVLVHGSGSQFASDEQPFSWTPPPHHVLNQSLRISTALQDWQLSYDKKDEHIQLMSMSCGYTGNRDGTPRGVSVTAQLYEDEPYPDFSFTATVTATFFELSIADERLEAFDDKGGQAFSRTVSKVPLEFGRESTPRSNLLEFVNTERSEVQLIDYATARGYYEVRAECNVEALNADPDNRCAPGIVVEHSRGGIPFTELPGATAVGYARVPSQSNLATSLSVRTVVLLEPLDRLRVSLFNASNGFSEVATVPNGQRLSIRGVRVEPRPPG